ncbi:GH92 family glycosyl hydrolase [Sunxiuqinia sp. A32]|uniref:GH92 family glycosyl hydrolase n=1 Tax=Sunxiuqinia sp. A32 TaxID=3461496 RepID=UPI004045F96F
MKKYLFYLLLSLLFACGQTNTKKTDYCQYVDPFIGTGGHGHTYPGASVPFGMVKLSPDTRLTGWDGCGGYHYSDSIVYGFSHTHLSGTGVSDYGDILFMPTVGEISLSNKEYSSKFSHENETSEPGYYSVLLDDSDVKVELSASERVGVHQYTFPKSDAANLIIDLTHRDTVLNAELKIVSDTEIEGFRKSTNWALNMQWYFVAQFSKPFKNYGLAKNNVIDKDLTMAEGRNIKGYLQFDTNTDEVVLVKVGISAVSIEGARKNLQEVDGLSFDEIRANSKQEWNRNLAKIHVEGGTLAQRRNFYTALYHSMLTPDLYMDIDGQYRGMDDQVHTADGFENYTVFSLWDTYRALHPLLTIIDKERTNDIVNTLIHKYKESGELPMWELAANDTRCMIGYHAVSVIADAYQKGIRDYDADAAWEAMNTSANVSKRGIQYYKELGFVPSNKSSQSVSKTLEYAYDDWCIAQFAKLTGREEAYKQYAQRSQFYENVFDASSGFMRGKNANRSWREPFNPQSVNYDFTEGNSYQYIYVPHHVNRLIELSGGDEKFTNWLNDLFETSMEVELEDGTDVTGLIGQYAHGNEPSHHIAYMYNYVGKPWKTQAIIRKIMDDLYQDTPDGLCGNEDCGQMSAWYVMSAMGMYPMAPGDGKYIFGSPIFDKVVISLESGETFTITAKNQGTENKYIQSAKLNGKEYDLSYILHSDIEQGGEIVFEMGPEPNKVYGQKESSRPVSVKEMEFVSIPYLYDRTDYFIDQYTVNLGCDTYGADIYYTTDGTTPDNTSTKFTKPFVINETTELKFVAYKEGVEPSFVAEKTIKKAKPSTGNFKKGVQYEYFEGVYRSARDFAHETPVKTGITDSFDLSKIDRDEWIAVGFKSYINIPKDGTYTIYMNANDGGQLIFDGTELFESDGRKSFAFEQKASLNLKKGKYPLDVNFFQCSDAIKLELSWEGPGFSKQLIPAKNLFH